MVGEWGVRDYSHYTFLGGRVYVWRQRPPPLSCFLSFANLGQVKLGPTRGEGGCKSKLSGRRSIQRHAHCVIWVFKGSRGQVTYCLLSTLPAHSFLRILQARQHQHISTLFPWATTVGELYEHATLGVARWKCYTCGNQSNMPQLT